MVSDGDLFHDYYSGCLTSLILKPDSTQYTANGFTNLIEAMAMARPVIVTRTGALPEEVDVGKAGCGLFVSRVNLESLAAAMETLANDPERARAMGEKGHELVESHYNINRYASPLFLQRVFGFCE